LIRCLYASVWAKVKVDVYDVIFGNSGPADLFGNGIHETGFAAAADTGYDFDNIFRVIESADLLQIVFSWIEFHKRLLLSGRHYSTISCTKSQVNEVIFEKKVKSAYVNLLFRYNSIYAFPVLLTGRSKALNLRAKPRKRRGSDPARGNASKKRILKNAKNGENEENQQKGWFS
jgi:hypothetical protein